MTTLSFDTLLYVDKLVQAGVPEIQARSQSSALADVFRTAEKDLVTKHDLDKAVSNLENKIDKVAGEINLVKLMLGVLLAVSIANFAKQYF